MQQNVEGIPQFQSPNSVLEPHFVQIIVGKPGSGKTQYMQDLILNQNYYGGKFDYHIFISPSEFPKIKAHGDNFAKKLDLNWLFNKLMQIKQQQKNDNRINILIVLDDVVSQMKDLEKEQLLNNLFLNRRHIIPQASISILISTQKYNLIPLRFRTVATSLILFDINNKEFECIRNEHFKNNNQANEIRQKLGEIVRNQYQFMFIKLSPFIKIYNSRFQQICLQEELMQEFIQNKIAKGDCIIQKNEVTPIKQIVQVQEIKQTPKPEQKIQQQFDPKQLINYLKFKN